MSGPPDGFRGYIASRPVRATSYPQRVQNLVVRSYAERHGLPFKLSYAEYAMPDCFMMLETLLSEMPKLQGAIAFSMFMLPPLRSARERVYACMLDRGAELHAALEETVIRTPADIALFEDTIHVAAALRRAPLGGRFGKDGRAPSVGSAPFIDAVMRALRPS